MSGNSPSKFWVIFRSVLFLGLFLALFIWLFKRQGYETNDFLKLPVKAIWAWAVLIGLTWLINGQKIKFLLKHWKIQFPLKEAFALAAASSLFNFFPLQGGMAARGFYLKKRYHLPATHYSSLLAASYFILVFIQGTIGLILCLTLESSKKVNFLIFLFTIALLITLILVLFRIPLAIRNRLSKGRFSFVTHIHQHFLSLLKDYRCFLSVLFFDFLLLIVESTKIYLAFYLLGYSKEITLKATVLMANLTIPSVLLNITPAGLGIRESAITLVAVIFHFKVEEAFFAGSFDRILTMVIIFTFGLVCALWVLNQYSKPSPQLGNRDDNLINRSPA